MKTNFKNGDVIAIRNPRGVEMLAIFDKFVSNETLHIYVEYNTSEAELYFQCDNFDFCYDLNKIEYRLATDDEKENLYYHLFIHFTEDWDNTWYNHFTDSSYFDIIDCLLDAFAIEVIEDDWYYPDFVQDIRNYIWDKCCEALCIESDIHIPSSRVEEHTDSGQEQMVRLDDICSWVLQNMIGYVQAKEVNRTDGTINIEVFVDNAGLVNALRKEFEMKDALKK